jgi:hypothetical protein
MEFSGTSGTPAVGIGGIGGLKVIEALAAEEALAEAEVRLQQAQFDALLGIRYDADEFDKIIVAYRGAKRAADGVWLRSSRAAVAAPASPARYPTFGQAAGLAA